MLKPRLEIDDQNNPGANMPNYRIIGADMKEYGPASPQQIRQWITEGRVDSETKLRLEGQSEWKRLPEIPELTRALPDGTPSRCPKCGESFQDGFDSCWKCGTGRDGSPAKEFTTVEETGNEEAEARGNPCPGCGSVNVRLGKLKTSGESSSIIFEPQGKRFFTLSFMGGVELADGCSACLDCGLVWSHLRPAILKEFIFKHCQRSGHKDAYRLLAMAARLEAQGDPADALAEYEAVKQQFPGTKAADHAEASIRNLKRNMG
jgi:predicted nucleic-acid-binding Zn-ribbon protein